MKRLTIFVVAVALLYSAYWFAGARAVSQTAEGQIAALQAEGWDITYDDLSVRGFPSRFDTSVAAVRATSADGLIQYAAPFVQALALSYQPNKVIIALPATQQVTLAGQEVTVDSTGLRASVGVKPNTALPLDTITAEAEAVQLRADFGTLAFTDFLAASRASGPLPNSYDVYLNAQEISVPSSVLGRLNTSGLLPDAIEVVTADATVALDRPLNRHTIPQWESDPGKLRAVTLRTLNLRWGQFAVTGEGDVTVDAAGVPAGEIALTITQWRQLLDVALSAGLMPPNARFMAQSIGETLSQGSDDLDLPLTFTNGNMALGAFPLGPAPNFH